MTLPFTVAELETRLDEALDPVLSSRRPAAPLARALVLVFPHAKQVSGINEGARFRFKCTVANFDYQYVHLEDCSIVR